MNIEKYEIAFSLDQPDSIGPRVLEKLQQVLTQTQTSTGRKMSHVTHHVLVVDGYRERSRYLEALLSVAGYRHMVAATAVEAFTLILQEMCVPFAIILGQDDANQRFFLNRIFQRMQQRYDWDLLLIHLHAQAPSQEKRSSSGIPSSMPQMFPQTGDNGYRHPGPGPVIASSMPPQTSLPGFSTFSSLFGSATSQAAENWSLPGIAPSPVTPTLPHVQSTDPLALGPRAPSGPLPPIQQMSPMPAETRAEPSAAKALPNIPLVGQDIGRYHVVARLGSAQVSNTYRAYDRLREKDVALKALHTDAIPYHLMEGAMDEEHIFQQEAGLLEGLEHPHLLSVLNIGRSYISGTPFVYKTMLLCSGGSLAQWLREHGAPRMYSLQEVLPLVWQLADALQYLHDHGLVYQNFKLSNILIKNDAEDLRTLQFVLSDLSVLQGKAFIAQSPDAYAYVAPERWLGLVLPASDQYALAAITYELLTGRPPFQGSSESTMKRLHTTMAVQPPGAYNTMLPPLANDIMLRALAKKPEDRFASVATFARVFQSYFG